MRNEYFSKAIIDWYKENKRELPWRESSDPYLIWISKLFFSRHAWRKATIIFYGLSSVFLMCRAWRMRTRMR